MDYRLLAMDLDETLLNRDHQISSYNKEMIQKAYDLQVKIIIATGRMYISALPYYQELNLDTPMINYNGALIVSPKGEFIYHAPIDSSLAKDLIATIKEFPCHLNLYIEDRLYAEKRSRELLAYEEISGIKGHIVEDLASLLHLSPTKMVIISFNDDLLQSIEEELHRSFGDSITLTPTRKSFLEVMPRGISKGEALKRVVEGFHLHPKEVMAIGDGKNDLSMIEYAGLGIAVENGHKDLKERAQVIAPSQDGVGHSIATYILKKEDLLWEK